MSQVKLNLQPPPNVDFVTGYPGIPPGSDRPQAAVKGAIEVRIPAQGVKAKWVRIELRKVETLPGGGAPNTFYDFVGPSPVNLWTSSEEYSILRSQDFPFSIRIPESIPPTVSLDNRAGIGYELVATVCTKGKKGFLRKAKPVVVSTISPIIIDKHDLHSTWPVYCQPETRHISQDGVNLSVQRNNTCYGPGDRISVSVMVKSDSLHTIILRTLELSLRETTVFRAGIIGPGKKSAPQEKQINIAEAKVAVNATLYGGSSHTADLSCLLSPAHTTTTLNAARHIDVTYTLCIKALFGTGGPLVMELPVIISNWQRSVSYEAISRIGAAHSLSLGNSITSARIDPTRVHANTLPASSSNIRRPSEEAAATYGGSTRIGANGLADEFGATRQAPMAVTTNAVLASHAATSHALSTTASNTVASRRPDSSGGGNRFAVTNAQPQDIPQSSQQSASATGSGQSPRNAQRAWPTAESEKLRLYEQAKAQVAKVQGPDPAALYAEAVNAQNRSAHGSSTTTVNPTTPPKTKPAYVDESGPSPRNAQQAWPTAEKEKMRLYEQAKAQAAKVQGPEVYAQVAKVQGPELYAQAINAQAINAQNRLAHGSTPSPVNSSITSPPKTKPAVPQYLSAGEEKAALRRYEEAKRAVDRTQYDEPPTNHALESSATIPYESLYPTATSSSRPVTTDEPPPPPFDTSSEITHGQYANALEEKEALRKRLEARDNAQAKAANPSPQPPARANGVKTDTNSVANASPGRNMGANGAVRPTPLPPAAATSRVLSAAEEKALLRAKFEARDAPANRKPAVLTNGNNHSSPPASNIPPPLMPRPPVEYIKETQEEDARLSKLNGEVPVIDLSLDNPRRGTPKPEPRI